MRSVARGRSLRPVARRGAAWKPALRWTAAGAGLAALTACAPSVPPTPEPIPVPAIDIDLPLRDAPLVYLPPPELGEGADPILHTRWARHDGLTNRAGYWMEVFTVRERDWFPVYLQRMARWEVHVDSVIAEAGLPRSLRYLPVIESGYSPNAVSVASAVGMWQFMAPVGRAFGLRVDPLVDERRDPVESTEAAIRYLGELHERFDSWFLALAAYNGGPSRVARLLRRHAPLAPAGDSLFFVIRDHLPQETRDFIPKFLAAAAVASQPERWGLAVPDTVGAARWESVELEGAASLDVVAGAAGIEEEVVRAWNPHIVRGVTPRGGRTTLRLPEGTVGGFRTAFAAIPADERVTVTEHVVARGETLSEIAERYGVRSRELQAANPDVRPRTMQIGTRLLVPLLPGSVDRARRLSSSAPRRARAIPASGIHVVRAGENLWAIARRYGLGVETLKGYNGLDGDPVIRPGDQIRLRGSS